MHHDVAILGSGFGGSIAALIAKKLGMNPILIEKGTHPRFTIGESSTPQANIALSYLVKKYNLPTLAPLTQYGTWKDNYPGLACGPKRGFTYIHHGANGGELLVAANPSQYEADTHWYRSDIDSFLVNEVIKAGIPYVDNVDVVLSDDSPWRLKACNFSCTADFVIDATGGANPLQIPQDIHTIQTSSRVMFAHFKGVTPWGEVHGKPEHPYPCHDAALHHIFAGGWMYVLHFDTGITSAGFVLDTIERSDDTWESLMEEFPSIYEQFQNAERVTPLIETQKIQRCSASFSDGNWAMLPHSAYFIDPLHSTGIAHTLHCIDRLLQSIGNVGALIEYDTQMRQEIRLIDQLVHGSYACMSDFDSFANFVMLYFAGADFSERQRRNNIETGFLNIQDESYRVTVDRVYKHAVSGRAVNNLGNEIEPWNLVGLCDPAKQNMYDYA